MVHKKLLIFQCDDGESDEAVREAQKMLSEALKPNFPQYEVVVFHSLEFVGKNELVKIMDKLKQDKTLMSSFSHDNKSLMLIPVKGYGLVQLMHRLH